MKKAKEIIVSADIIGYLGECIHKKKLCEDCFQCHWDNGCSYGKASGHGEGDHIEDCDCE